MSTKLKPIGICDHCLGPIAPEQWYTSKRKPRQFCCRQCRNTAIARRYAAPVNRERMLAQVADGSWVNPQPTPPTPAEQARRARLGRMREVAAGTWRNPGLTPEARAINSQPEKHTGALAAAIEKLKRGASVRDLTPEEQDAHRAYRRALAAALRQRRKTAA